MDGRHLLRRSSRAGSSGVERVEAEGTGRSFGELDEKPPLKKGVDKRWAELSRGEWIS